MSGVFELDQAGWEKRVADDQLTPADTSQAEKPGFWEGIPGAIGNQFMRGGVKVNDLLLTASDLVYPMSDEERAQQQDLRSSGLDFWTPNAKTTGTAGKVLGGLSELGLPLLLGGGNPAFVVGSNTLAGGKELVDEGVDAKTAGGIGALEGAATYAGFKLPFLGKSLLSKMLTGAAGNTVLGGLVTKADQALLESNGYQDLAKNYDPLDPTSRAIDAVTGLVLGGLAHVRGGPSLDERAAVLTAANAKHFQQDTAPGIPADANSSAVHQEAMRTAFDQTMKGEPVNVSPEVTQATFRPRPAREPPDEQVWRDVFGEDMPKAPELETVGQKSAVPGPDLIPHADIAALDVEPQVRASMSQAFERAARVKPQFDASVRDISREIGTPHEPLIPAKLKGAARTAEKAIADYGGDVSKVKDLVRATVVVDTVPQAMAAVEAAKARFGEPTKFRNGLVPAYESPDGYRDINLNFDVGGHTVELQVNLPEMLKAKESAHKLYEERRTIEAETKKTGEVAPEQLARMNELDSKMSAGYAAAWKEALSRSKASSEIGTPSSRGSRKETALPPGTSQARTEAPPSDVGTMDTGTPSQSKYLGRFSNKDMTDSSGAIIPQAAFESPIVTAVKELLTQQDVKVPTGAVDENGNLVVRSAREIMSENDAAIAKAEADAKGIEAAVNCFLTRGNE